MVKEEKNNHKERLLSQVSKIVEGPMGKALDYDIITIKGSLGDPNGYVHSGSNLNFNLFSSNLQHSKKRGFKWGESQKIFKSVKSQGREFNVVYFPEFGIVGSFLFKYFEPSKFKKRLEALEQNPASSELWEVDNLISESLNAILVRDSDGLYEEASRIAQTLFESQRERFALDEIEKLRGGDVWQAIKNRGMVQEGIETDAFHYNGKITQVVSSLLYILCCAENIPISLNDITHRRKNVLLDKLDLDQDEFESTLVSSQKDIPEAYSNLIEFSSKIYSRARESLPALNNSKSKANLKYLLRREML